MPKKKRSLFRKKYKKNGGKLPGAPKGGRPPGVPWKSNPSPATDLLYEVVPGAAGFAVTKVVSRIAFGVAQKRGSKWAKHINVLASAATFGLLWAAAHRVKQIAEYHTPIVVGSAIATLQTAIQTYVPQYGWLIGHPNELDAAPGSPTAVGGDGLDYDNLLEGADDDDIYDDSMEARPSQPSQRRRPRQQAAPTRPQAQAAAQSSNDDLEDLINDITDDGSEGAGIFSN